MITLINGNARTIPMNALDEWGEGIKAEANHGDLPLFRKEIR